MSQSQSLAKAGAVVPEPLPEILNAAVSSGSFSLSFGTENGKTYDVEYTESLVNPKWLPLLTVFGDGSVATINDPAQPSGQRFYRFRAR